MSLSDIYWITHNKTFMIFIFSSIAAVTLGVYSISTTSIADAQDRRVLLNKAELIESEIAVIKAQVIEELSKPDNLTLINPANITLVVPNTGDNGSGDSGKIAGIGDGPIIIK